MAHAAAWFSAQSFVHGADAPKAPQAPVKRPKGVMQRWIGVSDYRGEWQTFDAVTGVRVCSWCDEDAPACRCPRGPQ